LSTALRRTSMVKSTSARAHRYETFGDVMSVECQRNSCVPRGDCSRLFSSPPALSLPSFLCLFALDLLSSDAMWSTRTGIVFCQTTSPSTTQTKVSSTTPTMPTLTSRFAPLL
jgi:hypothetical protein